MKNEKIFNARLNVPEDLKTDHISVLKVDLEGYHKFEDQLFQNLCQQVLEIYKILTGQEYSDSRGCDLLCSFIDEFLQAGMSLNRSMN